MNHSLSLLLEGCNHQETPDVGAITIFPLLLGFGLFWRLEVVIKLVRLCLTSDLEKQNERSLKCDWAESCLDESLELWPGRLGEILVEIGEGGLNSQLSSRIDKA